MGASCRLDAPGKGGVCIGRPGRGTLEFVRTRMALMALAGQPRVAVGPDGADFKLEDHWTLGVSCHYGTEAVARSNLLSMGSIIGQHDATIGIRYEWDHGCVGAGYLPCLPETLKGGARSDFRLGMDYGLSELEQTRHNAFFGFGWSW